MYNFVECMEQMNRICDYYDKCNKCPISLVNNGYDTDCFTFIRKHPQEAEQIIMDWAEKQLDVTNAEKFKEVFGFKPFGCVINPEMCDMYNGCKECSHNKFWEQKWNGTKEN